MITAASTFCRNCASSPGHIRSAVEVGHGSSSRNQLGCLTLARRSPRADGGRPTSGTASCRDALVPHPSGIGTRLDLVLRHLALRMRRHIFAHVSGGRAHNVEHHRHPASPGARPSMRRPSRQIAGVGAPSTAIDPQRDLPDRTGQKAINSRVPKTATDHRAPASTRRIADAVKIETAKRILYLGITLQDQPAAETESTTGLVRSEPRSSTGKERSELARRAQEALLACYGNIMRRVL